MHLNVKKENFLIALNKNQSKPNYNAGTTIPFKIIDFNISAIRDHVSLPPLEYIAQDVSVHGGNVKIFKF